MKEPKSEAANQDGSPALASAHLLDRLKRHIAILAPHQTERLTGQLLIAATKEIERLGCTDKPSGSSREEIQAAIVETVNQIDHLQNRLKWLRAMRSNAGDERPERLKI